MWMPLFIGFFRKIIGVIREQIIDYLLFRSLIRISDFVEDKMHLRICYL